MRFHQLASTLDAVMIGYGFAMAKLARSRPWTTGCDRSFVFLFSCKGPPARSGVSTRRVNRPERGKALDRAAICLRPLMVARISMTRWRRGDSNS